MYRRVQAEIWGEDWFLDLEVPAKMVYLWASTSKHMTAAGAAKVGLRTIAFETGCSKEEVQKALQQLHPTILYLDGYLVFPSFYATNNGGANWMRACARELNLLPEHIRQRLQRPSHSGPDAIGMPSGCHRDAIGANDDSEAMPSGCHRDAIAKKSDAIVAKTEKAGLAPSSSGPSYVYDHDSNINSSSSSSSFASLPEIEADDDEEDEVKEFPAGVKSFGEPKAGESSTSSAPSQSGEGVEEQPEPVLVLDGGAAPLFTGVRPASLPEATWEVYKQWAMRLGKRAVPENCLTDSGRVAIEYALRKYGVDVLVRLIQAKEAENKAKRGKPGWTVHDSLEELFDPQTMKRYLDTVRPTLGQDYVQAAMQEIEAALKAGVEPDAWSHDWVAEAIERSGGWQYLIAAEGRERAATLKAIRANIERRLKAA